MTGPRAMTREELHALADRLEARQPLDGETAARVAATVAAAFPDRAVSAPRAAEMRSTDPMLALVAEALPSWTVHVTGHSATVAGRWTCTIRETGVRDDDELIGVGKADTLAQAVLAALLKVIALRGPAR